MVFMAKTKHNQKHTNQVRIIGGTHRGRKITFQSADGLRPTPDMVREKLFNWLGQDLTGKTVLDLFAGSGALGLEAASRHAKKVLLVENNRRTASELQRYVREWNMQQAQVNYSDGLLFLTETQEQFDLVLLDPPFAWQKWPELFDLLKGRLKHHAQIYIEAGTLPLIPDWLQIHREGCSGMSCFALLNTVE